METVLVPESFDLDPENPRNASLEALDPILVPTQLGALLCCSALKCLCLSFAAKLLTISVKNYDLDPKF